jgi:L-seryl-tRNA(Ser) seleniumtransferase
MTITNSLSRVDGEFPEIKPEAGESPPAPNVTAALRRLPAVDTLLQQSDLIAAIDTYGRKPVLTAVRAALEEARARIRRGDIEANPLEKLAGAALACLAADRQPHLRPVFNLTGTVIHTNLGRAPLAEAAIAAMITAARSPVTLEYSLARGGRGDRDDVVADLLRGLTGAEAATVVNNNAAAVLLALQTLAAGHQVVISRGELIEIGGSFRIPDIMAAAGCQLVEVGTTNRTYPYDYQRAINPATALIVKAHTSNYIIQGFTAEVAAAELARIAHEADIPFMIDLGSGALVDLSRYGLPREPLPQEALAAGADLVTFSGDKLLGGPQAGIIVGRRELITAIKKHPLKRALRCGKLTLAALEATLRLYRDSDDLPEQLPALRLFIRAPEAIAATGQRLLPELRQACSGVAEVSLVPCLSQIGSGALPVDRLPSWALVLKPGGQGENKRATGQQLTALERAFRALPRPVLGRLAEDALWFDLHCVASRDDEAEFCAQLVELRWDNTP